MHHISGNDETLVNDQTIIDSVDDNRLMDMITHLLMLANSLKRITQNDACSPQYLLN